MGSEGYLINQMLAPRDQPPHRRVGRHARTSGCASRSRSYAVRARPWATASRSSTGSRCSTWSRAARPGTRSSTWRTRSRRPAPPSSTPASAGTRRGCRRSSPRCRAAPGARSTARLKAEVTVPVCRLQPDQHPRAGRGRSSPPARPTWCRWRGRSSPTPTSSPRRPPGGPTRSTPASPATRPASTTSSPTARRRAWSTRAPGARPSSCCCRSRRRSSEVGTTPRRSGLDSARPPSVAVVGAGPAGPRRRGERRGARLRGHPVRAGPEVGGQFRLAMRIPGKEEFAETLRYFSRRLEVLGAGCGSRRAPTVDELASYDEVIVATGVDPADPGPRRRRPPHAS